MKRWIVALILAATGATMTAVAAKAEDYRIEAMGGWNTSDFGFARNFTVANEKFNIDITSESLGDGPSWGAGVWIDDWIGRNGSVGFQYVGLKLQGTTSSVVGTIGNVPVVVGLGTNFVMHSFGTNLAWRKYQGQWHPYVGGGLFIGVADGTLTGFAGIPGAAGVASTNFNVPFAGVQGIAGLDVDLTESIYIGFSGRAMYVDARPIGINLQILNLVGLAKIGYKF